MSQTDSISVKVHLKSPTEKFYDFFKNHVGDLVHMFPEHYESIQFVEEENFSTGSVILFKYQIGGKISAERYSTRVVDDNVKKYIVYEAVEGDVLKHYRVFRVKFEVVKGGLSKVGGGSFAKWNVDFEKANENVPSPENYLELFIKISKGVDAYLLKN